MDASSCEARRLRVVMAVNNPATVDYRVVKSAAALQTAGYDCHVVGALKEGFDDEEVVDGVTYHRVRVRFDLSCLFVGFFPLLFHRLLGGDRRERVERDRRTGLIGSTGLIGTVQRAILFVVSLLSRPLKRTLNVAVVALLGSVFLAILLALNLAKGGLVLLVYLVTFPALVVGTVLTVVTQAIRGGLQLLKTVYASARNDEAVSFPVVPKTLWRISRKYDLTTVYAKGWRYVTRYVKTARVRLSRRLKRYLRPLNPVSLLKSRVFAPNASVFGVKLLQGRYLRSFYTKLVSLEGDIYHAHELWLLETCSLAARATGATVVYDSHELEAHRNPPPRPQVKRARMQCESRYIREAGAVIAVSEGCAREIGKTYSPLRVHVLKNVPVLGRLRPPARTLRESLELSTEVPLVVYTGSVTINRGLEKVLEALQHLPGFVLATVGPWNEEVKEELLTISRGLGVADRFLMHDKVPPEELIDFISSADLAVLPIQNACLSYYYCMPNKLFEAMFAGLPMVVSDFPDMRTVVTESEVGATCDERAPRSIASSIKAVYEARSSFYPDGKVTALRQRYCFENESKVLTDLYEQLAAPSEKRRLASIGVEEPAVGR